MALEDGLKGIEDATTELGFNTDAIKEKLQSFVLDLGKINFKDLNAQEKAQALQAAFSGQLNTAVSGALNSIIDPIKAGYLDAVQKTGEEYITTLVRVANEHEAVRTQLAMFGQTVGDFVQSNALVEAAGGLAKFQGAMSVFTKNFFSSEEQHRMQELQLKMALFQQNVALPANKAAFRQLVLETQQRIISLQARIEIAKADILAEKGTAEARVMAAKMKMHAEQSMANAGIQSANIQINAHNRVIRSAQEGGKAIVGFGRSMFNAVKAATSGVGSADIQGTETGTIDVSSITSGYIRGLESQLSKAQSLYGTLMSNMGTFASYYNDAESIATNAREKAEEARRKAEEARKKSLANIDSFNNMFLTKQQLLEKQAKSVGTHIATTVNGLKSIFTTLKGGVGGLTDAELAFLKANKEYIDAKKEEAKAKRREQIDLINTEISLRNKLNDTIRNMQESVYDSFETLLGKDVPELINNLRNDIADKKWGKIAGDFTAYANELKDTSTSKEAYLRGIISANALVQKVPVQNDMELLDTNLAIEANTFEIAKLQEISLGLERDKLKSTESSNKLDRNIELLEELIALQKEANAKNAEGIEIQKEAARDAMAAEIRARSAV